MREITGYAIILSVVVLILCMVAMLVRWVRESREIDKKWELVRRQAGKAYQMAGKLGDEIMRAYSQPTSYDRLLNSLAADDDLPAWLSQGLEDDAGTQARRAIDDMNETLSDILSDDSMPDEFQEWLDNRA